VGCVWGWLAATLLTVLLAARIVADRRRLAAERRQRAAEVALEAERDRLARLPVVFAHYRERLELVRERLAASLADPGREPGIELDDWPRRSRDFARVLGAGSESYRVLAAAYRGVASVGGSADPDRIEPVLQMVDRALAAVDEAIDKACSPRR
jgi:hypothetical protein